jgi:chromosome partitioning protein
MQIITVAAMKGGVSKTTTALAMGICFYYLGKRTLFIDLDPQGNLSHTLRADNDQDSVYDILSGTVPITNAVRNIKFGDCLAASPSLASAERSLDRTGKEYLLKEALARVNNDYDVAVIDTPPSLGILTINALTACRDMIIPSLADIYSIQGLTQVHESIEAVKKYCNPSLTIAGILLTRMNRTILGGSLSGAIGELAAQFQTKVFNTRIRECVAVKEAQALQTDLYPYAPKCTAALDYLAFMKEYTGDINQAAPEQGLLFGGRNGQERLYHGGGDRQAAHPADRSGSGCPAGHRGTLSNRNQEKAAASCT